MKIILATTIYPFMNGGAEYLTDSLCDTLAAHGHDVERFELPFSSDYRTMMQEMLALRLLNLSDAGDRLITIRTPSYLIQHHTKVIWFIHHHRASFDLWGTANQDVPRNAVGEGYREAFRSADNLALREAHAVYANSRRMRGRLIEFNEFDAEVLYPPLKPNHGLFSSVYGDYILCPGRMTWHKRQQLCLEALRHTTTPVRMIIAGPPASPDDAALLEENAAAWGLSGRVTILGRWIEEDEKAKLFANALAVAYAPYDEDSYGYVSLEAAQAHKAVITCDDSGGVLELVEDGVNGFVASPTPEAIAECFDRLWDRPRARSMGEASFERLSAMQISWDRVVEKLLV